MKIKTVLTTWVLLALGLSSTMLYGCGDHTNSPSPENSTEETASAGLTEAQFSQLNFLSSTVTDKEDRLFLLANSNHVFSPAGGDIPDTSSLSQMDWSKITDDYSVLDLRVLQNRSIAVGQVGSVFLSEEPLGTWNRIETPTESDLLTIEVVKKGIFVGGSHGTLLFTSDRGKQWSEKSFSVLTFCDIEFKDSTGFAVADYGTVIKSTDGGDSWTTLRGGDITNFDLSPYFTVSVSESAETVFTGGLNGLYSVSTNGGDTWADYQIPRGSTIYDSLLTEVAGGSGFLFVTEAGELLFAPLNRLNCVYRQKIIDSPLQTISVLNNFFITAGFNGSIKKLKELDSTLVRGTCTPLQLLENRAV